MSQGDTALCSVKLEVVDPFAKVERVHQIIVHMTPGDFPSEVRLAPVHTSASISNG